MKKKKKKEKEKKEKDKKKEKIGRRGEQLQLSTTDDLFKPTSYPSSMSQHILFGDSAKHVKPQHGTQVSFS